MSEIKKQKTYLDKSSRQKKVFNQSKKTRGRLTKDGLVYKNNLLDADLTAQTPTRRKLK